MARKPQELRPVMVRLPEKLRRWLERVAAENGRSMNTEIIYRLEQSVASEPELERLMARVERALLRLNPAENGEEGKS
jgi:Arc-like DNA binding domain